MLIHILLRTIIKFLLILVMIKILVKMKADFSHDLEKR